MTTFRWLCSAVLLRVRMIGPPARPPAGRSDLRQHHPITIRTDRCQKHPARPVAYPTVSPPWLFNIQPPGRIPSPHLRVLRLLQVARCRCDAIAPDDDEFLLETVDRVNVVVEGSCAGLLQRFVPDPLAAVRLSSPR